MPVSSHNGNEASSSSALQKRFKSEKCLEILNFEDGKLFVMCNLCCKISIVAKSNNVTEHITAAKPQKCISLQKKRQATIVPTSRGQQVEDTSSGQLQYPYSRCLNWSWIANLGHIQQKIEIFFGREYEENYSFS